MTISFRSAINTLFLPAALSLSAMTGVPGQEVSVPTFHMNAARLGWNAAETGLTPQNVRVGSFGKLWQTPLDGGVPASPLLLSGVTVGGQKRNVVYAATDHNSVFALDAGTGSILWERRQLFAPLTDAQFTGSWFGDGRHGILGTPVIDPATGNLYVCTIRAKGLRQVYDVWALDIRTGETRPGWPVTLKGTYKNARFTPGQVLQRGALSLIDGWVYVPFGGRGDIPPWRGWLMGVDTQHPDAPQRAFCSSPDTDGAGIWSGGGAAADLASGDIFLGTGNGTYDVPTGGSNVSESVLRLTTRAATFDFTRLPRDFYTPANYEYLDEEDEDLGGATPLVLPDLPATSTPHVVFMGGKDGLAYLLNRDNMGGIGGEIQKERFFDNPTATYHEGIRSTSVYFDAGDTGRFIFIAGDNPGPDNNKGMVALRLSSETATSPIRMKKIWTLKRDLNGPSSPFGSSNGTQNGLVWVVETNDGSHSALLAYDAMSGEELYNSNSGPAPDHFDNGYRFTSPIVANGRVFVGANGVVCFGRLPADGEAKKEN